MRFLKQSTGVIVQLGPFVDATDGVTAETALSPSSTNVRLYKAEGTTAVDIYDATWTHIGLGEYRVTLTSTHTDTAGPLTIVAQISGARPVVHEFNVLASTSYDALMSGAAIPSNMTKLAGNATAAELMYYPALGIKPVTVGSGSSTTRIATNLTESVSDHWNGGTLIFVSGTLAGQRTSITDYNGSTKELTVSALTAAPSAGDIAVIV